MSPGNLTPVALAAVGERTLSPRPRSAPAHLVQPKRGQHLAARLGWSRPPAAPALDAVAGLLLPPGHRQRHDCGAGGPAGPVRGGHLGPSERGHGFGRESPGDGGRAKPRQERSEGGVRGAGRGGVLGEEGGEGCQGREKGRGEGARGSSRRAGMQGEGRGAWRRGEKAFPKGRCDLGSGEGKVEPSAQRSLQRTSPGKSSGEVVLARLCLEAAGGRDPTGRGSRWGEAALEVPGVEGQTCGGFVGFSGATMHGPGQGLEANTGAPRSHVTVPGAPW